MSDGLRHKYNVERVDGRDKPGGDKANARYFVLDYANDPFAREALFAYATGCSDEYPDLARDLLNEVATAKFNAEAVGPTREDTKA